VCRPRSIHAGGEKGSVISLGSLLEDQLMECQIKIGLQRRAGHRGSRYTRSRRSGGPRRLPISSPPHWEIPIVRVGPLQSGRLI
jgi:hypothetical protein